MVENFGLKLLKIINFQNDDDSHHGAENYILFLYRIYRHRVLSCRVKPFMVPSCVDNNNEFSLFCLMVCVNWEGEGSKKDAELKNYKYNIWLAMYRKVLAHHPGQSVSLARHKSNNDNKLIIINRASISFAPGPPPQWQRMTTMMMIHPI